VGGELASCVRWLQELASARDATVLGLEAVCRGAGQPAYPRLGLPVRQRRRPPPAEAGGGLRTVAL